MLVFFIAYFILLTLTLVYVAVNIYHIVRFRLDVTGDKSTIGLALYLIVVTAVLVGSVVMATIASKT